VINLIDPILRIRGVGDAVLQGELDYSMRVWLDPEAAHRVPVDAERRRHCRAEPEPAGGLGRVGAAPMPQLQQFQLNIKAVGRLTKPEEFGDIVVRANEDGSWSASGTWRAPSSAPNRSTAHPASDGAPGAAIASTSRLARMRRAGGPRCKLMDRLKRDFPRSRYEMFYDASVS